MTAHETADVTADVTAIVPAAGRGTRFGAERNKVLMPLNGRPILRWTLEALAACPEVAEIIVAVSGEDADEIAALCRDLPVPCRIVPGGDTRQMSVRNALAEARQPILAVHDAARPLMTPDIVTRCIESVRAHGTGIAAVPVADTLKRQADQFVLETSPREEFWGAQTPQCCRADDLRAAYAAAEADGFAATDEASLLEHTGMPVRLALGSSRNLKITTPDDLAVAGAIVRARSAQERQEPEGKPMAFPRIGYGYDIHRYAEGRRMILAGVDFGLDYGPTGHSDADALLHAVMDALLGAAGLPDIGHLFPNTDERWRGADSMDLLAEVVRRVHAEGYTVGNVDATVIAERPKISPHATAMRANIARACGIPESAVGLKATTAEGLGDLGSGLGIAAHAVCLLVGGM